jgi:Tol biopolymer transport system component
VAISPDGTQIAYVADSQLYLRAMSELEGRPITGRDQGMANPIFSPDGRSIAFYTPTSQAIRRVAVSGGAAVTFPTVVRRGLAGYDGIVFAVSASGVFRVAPMAVNRNSSPR